MKRIFIVEVSSSLLILLYTYTSISKLLGFQRFRYALSQSPLIDKAGIVAWLIPIAELLIVLLLLIPAYRKTGLSLSLALLAIFTSYLFYMVSFSTRLPCSCGGVINTLNWKQHIFFNLFFIGINILGLKALRFPVYKNVT